MSILLLLPKNFPKPHRIPIRGASSEDIAHTARQCELIFELAISALQGQLSNLSENLPVTDAGYLDAKGIATEGAKQGALGAVGGLAAKGVGAALRPLAEPLMRRALRIGPLAAGNTTRRRSRLSERVYECYSGRCP
mgnify:CR=1 FL=1